MSEKTTPVARMEAVGRNPGNSDKSQTPDCAALHPGYGTEFSHLPQGWVGERLENLVSFGGGYGFSERFQGRKDGDYPFYKVSDMSLLGNERYLTAANNYVSKKVAKQNGWAPFPAGSVVFAKVGAALLLNRRRVLTKESLIDNNMMAAIPTAIDEGFLYWWLQSVDFSIFVQPGAVPSVNQIQLGSLPVCLPLSHEQRRIAEILDTLDDAIQKTEQLIAKLKQIKQGLLHDLLTRGIDENGQLRDPIAHPEQFKDSVLGRIPKEWDVRKVFEICHLGRGRVISQIEVAEHPGVYPVYSSQSKDGGVFGHIDTYDFEGDYVTWTTDGAYAGTVFYRKGRFNCTNVCGTLQARSQETVMEYLATALARETFKYVSYIGNPKLMNNTMAQIAVALPPKPEQEAIVQALSSHDSREMKEVELLRKYIKLKKGLMHDLLTGKVRTMSGA